MGSACWLAQLCNRQHGRDSCDSKECHACHTYCSCCLLPSFITSTAAKSTKGMWSFAGILFCAELSNEGGELLDWWDELEHTF
jgi:hypothetical protein